MEIKKNLTENLFYIFFSICTVMLTVSSILRISDNRSPATVIITSFIFIALTLFIFLNRKKVAVYAGTAAIIILIFLALRAAGVSATAVLRKTSVHFFTGHTLKKGEVVLVTSIISMLFSAILFPLLRLRTIRYIILVYAVGLLVFYGISEYQTDFVEKFSAAGIILSSLAELCLYILYPKNPLKQIREVLSFLLPMFTLFSLSAAIIPSSEKPINWNFVIKIIDTVGSAFSSVASEINFGIHPERSEFSIKLQGYSDSKNIFGSSISNNDLNQLKLSYRSKPCSSVYLTGNVSDTYTGKGWTRSSKSISSENEFYLDYYETMLAFERMKFTAKDIENFTRKTLIIINYDDIDTITLFYPLKTIDISADLKFDASLPSVVWRKRAKSQQKYVINYLEINYDSDEFKNTAKKKFNYDTDYQMYSSKLIDKYTPDNIMNILKNRSEYISDTYTKLPDFITERTYSLAELITVNCDNDYDKLCAIEKYLKGYTYTTTPGDVPEGSDPVDYFLFESFSGYCTYFASSMAILARCQGIPTRYVQGFAVDRNNFKSTDNNPINSSQAHAWVEAYIEGVGWIPFEPTASLSQSRYNFSNAPIIKFNPNGFDGYTPPENNENININVPASHDLEKEKTQSHILLYIFISAVFLLTLVLIVLIYTSIRIRAFKVKYRSETSTEKFIKCYRIIIYLFEKNKHKRKEGETIDRFIAGLSDGLYNDKTSLCLITSVFDRIRYGEGTASDEELKLCEKYLNDMFIKLRDKHGKTASFKVFAVYCLTN